MGLAVGEEQLQRLAPKTAVASIPVEVAHVCITQEQVGINSDTNLTGMCCMAIAAHRVCTLVHLTNLL